jgi:hypothetical protein
MPTPAATFRSSHTHHHTLHQSSFAPTAVVQTKRALSPQVKYPTAAIAPDFFPAFREAAPADPAFPHILLDTGRPVALLTAPDPAAAPPPPAPDSNQREPLSAVVPADPAAAGGGGGRCHFDSDARMGGRLREMLARLDGLGWRRVAVRFAWQRGGRVLPGPVGTWTVDGHNCMVVHTPWLHGAGRDVVRHLCGFCSARA